MGKQILITGTNSYVGTSFKQYIEKKNGNMPLEDRWHVTFVSVRNSEWKKMDFSKYDTILHVAAIVHQKEQPDMETLYYNVNTKLTVELAEKAKKEHVPQFIFFSTMSIYGKSKLEAEEQLLKLKTEEFTVSIVRPPMIYGKNCTGNYISLEKLAKLTPIFPKIANERSMLYIDNLSEFLYRITESKLGGIYCPQNRKYVNTSDMVVRIAENYDRKVWLVPGFQGIITLLAKKINIFAKVFGSLTYDWKMSFPEELGDYEVTDFLESIIESKNEEK